jgi:hypothetical protein
MQTETITIAHTGGGTSKPPDRNVAWRTWPREQLWLWPDPSPRSVRTRIRSVLAEALGALPAVEIESVSGLAEADEPGAALRLTARLLHRRTDFHGWQAAHDLAASALLLAMIEYRDEWSALEFVRLVHPSAGGAPALRFAAGRYPPPLDRRRFLRARLRRQAGLALSLVASSGAEWACTVDDLGRLGGGDPLAGLTARGQQPQPTAPGCGSVIVTRRPSCAVIVPDAGPSLPTSVPISAALVSEAVAVPRLRNATDDRELPIGLAAAVSTGAETALSMVSAPLAEPAARDAANGHIKAAVSYPGTERVVHRMGRRCLVPSAEVAPLPAGSFPPLAIRTDVCGAHPRCREGIPGGAGPVLQRPRVP